MIQPLVYVIVINWNGREHLDGCFSSLLESTCVNARFLLVDNASTDGSAEFVREFFGGDPRVELLVLAQNLGWSGGNNAGIQWAMERGADYIFLLNNDTATATGAISLLVEAMERDERLGALAPRMLLFDQADLLNSMGLRMSSIGAAWDIGIGRMDDPQRHRSEAIIGVCGGAMFLRASVLRETGLLPEDFDIYLDDLDLCLRIWNAGYLIMSCPEAAVRHKFSATMGEGLRTRCKYFLNTRNRFRILLRHFPLSSLSRVLPRLLLGEARAIGRSLVLGEAWRVLAHVRAWLATLVYLPTALRFRHAHPTSGKPAFWNLVTDAPQFCPHVVLPEEGWYLPITWNGERLRPMARRATLELSPGPLQVRLVNCYPAVGVARIVVVTGETLLADLATESTAEAAFDFPGGALTIRAESAFCREDTGLDYDAGAWIQVTREGNSLI
jgi:GT2 family glycosyltransferase